MSLSRTRDLDPEELKYVSREILVDWVKALQKERAAQRTDLQSALGWVAEEYRRCIVSARATTDGGHYEKCNGRAEAYRQLADRIAAAAGLAGPNWNAIKEAVPQDGIYRVKPRGGASC